MTKTLDGAWIVIALIPILVTVFKLTRSHYESVADQLSLANVEVDTTPHGHIVIVPIGGVHRAVIEALRYASALAKDVRAVYVNVNPDSLVQLKKDWPVWGSHVKLVVLQSPFRSMTEPLLDYIDRMEKEHPDDYITVVLPEFVVKHWWHHLLHNQSALTLKAALLFRPRVVTTSVPFHLTEYRSKPAALLRRLRAELRRRRLHWSRRRSSTRSSLSPAAGDMAKASAPRWLCRHHGPAVSASRSSAACASGRCPVRSLRLPCRSPSLGFVVVFVSAAFRCLPLCLSLRSVRLPWSSALALSSRDRSSPLLALLRCSRLSISARFSARRFFLFSPSFLASVCLLLFRLFLSTPTTSHIDSSYCGFGCRRRRRRIRLLVRIDLARFLALQRGVQPRQLGLQ